MKKFLAVLLSAALALSLSACNENSEVDSPNKGGTKEQEKIDKVLENVKPGTDEKEMWKILPKIDETPIANLEYEYNVEGGGMLITGYKVQSPKVRIPDKIEGEPVVGVDLREYTITEVIMPDTVKRAFLNKSCLQYANYPLSLETYENLFGEMSSGRSYSAPGAANEAFKGSAVEAVYIPNGVKFIPSNTFSGCKSLEKINIPITVTSLEDGCFYNCDSLKSIELPEYLNYIGSVGFAKDAVVSYKKKKYGADDADKLYELINYRDGMFIHNGVLIDCLDNVTKVEIPDSVTEIESGAFRDCTKLKSVTIPDSVTDLRYSDLNKCTSLTDVSYKGKTYSYDTIQQLYDLLSFGEGGMTIEKGVLKKVAQSLTEVVIPDNVTKIDRNAFERHENLKSVTIPDSVTIIGFDAFSHCTSLTNITIPNSVVEIDSRAFFGCTSLTTVSLPNGLTVLEDSVFQNCTSLSSITIPDSVTDPLYNSYSVRDPFKGCINLKNMSYRGKTYNSTDDLYDVFRYGESGLRIEDNVLVAVSPRLTHVVIPEGVTAIQGMDYVVEHSPYTHEEQTKPVFRYNSNIVSVVIPDSVERIGSYAFFDCENLKSVTFSGSGAKERSLSICEEAFGRCKNLTDITLPVHVYDIGHRAFAECTNLTSVKMSNPENVYSNVFECCSNLQKVTITIDNAPPGGDTGYIMEDYAPCRFPSGGYVGMFGYGCDALTSVCVVSTNKYYVRGYDGSRINSLEVIGMIRK